jgi:hypothetical protein
MSSDANNKRKSGEHQGVLKTSPRGNMDEFEAVSSIVTSNSGLLSRVLDKIRVQRRDNQTPGKSPNKPADQAKK